MKVGDVVIVTSTGRDKVTGKNYNYKWFGVVTHERRGFVRAYSLSTNKSRQIMASEAEVLPQDQWPDGVYALRAAAVLLGKIDI